MLDDNAIIVILVALIAIMSTFFVIVMSNLLSIVYELRDDIRRVKFVVGVEDE